MDTFVKAMRDIATERRSHAFMLDFAENVARIMRPFQPGRITLGLIDDIWGPTKVRVDIENLDVFVFPSSIDNPPFELAYVTGVLQEIYREFYTEPEDHIQLSIN